MNEEDLYPLSITEARYNGLYAGGAYVLMAGVHKPREQTDAFGGDVPCGRFWANVDENGDVIEVEPVHGNRESKEAIVISGNDISQLIKRFEQYKQRIQETSDNEAINAAFEKYKDIVVEAFDDDVARHKLAVAASGERDSSLGNIQTRVRQKVLYDRFNSDVRTVRDITEEEREEIATFAEEEYGRVPLHYQDPSEFLYLEDAEDSE